MKKAIYFALCIILVLSLHSYSVIAAPILNVSLDKESKTVSVSGTLDKEYADAPVGLWVTLDKNVLPDFKESGSTDVFISLQDTTVGVDGSFRFNDVILNAEGDVKFTLTALTEKLSEEISKTVYVPTNEAVTNFFSMLGKASSGEDILKLIEADLADEQIDGKNIRIGLDDKVYTVYSDIDKLDVATMIYDEIKDAEGLTVTQFDALHTEKAICCAFLSCDTPAEVWNFINVEKGDDFYNAIVNALSLEKTKNLSVIKRFAEFDETTQSSVLQTIQNPTDLNDWINKLAITIINNEMVNATDSYVLQLISTYSDVLSSFNYTKYNRLIGQQRSVAAYILKNAPYDSIKALCDAGNTAMNDIGVNNDTNIVTPQKPRPAGGGGGFFVSTKPVESVESTEPQMPLPTETPEDNEKFTDLASAEWALEAIHSLSGKNIINGKGDGKFYPNDNITREEFVKIIVLAFDVAYAAAECDFDDVDVNEWYYPYVAGAFQNGIVNGISNLEFGTGAPITREDVATILYRVMEDTDVTEQDSGVLEFTDSDDISQYAKDAVETLNNLGIVNGMEDLSFQPKEFCTRAQAAKMIYETLLRR